MVLKDFLGVLMGLFGAPGLVMIFVGTVIYQINIIHINPVTEKRRKIGLNILQWGMLLTAIAIGIMLYLLHLARR